MMHKDSIAAEISQRIKHNHGKISFAEYMQLVLYAPGLGYYSAGATKFGAAGDFVTAPELGTLFAQCVAQQCAQILALNPNSVILEIGAGSGQLACDLLTSLKKLNSLPKKYLILELSAELRQRQQQKIRDLCPEYMNIFTWLDLLPETAITGIILANEVLDAMPVTKFYATATQIQEYYVTEINNKLSYQLEPASEILQNAIIKLNLPNLPYESEINLWLPGWIKSLSESLNAGAILLFDYGFSRAEYYHPERSTGTLMCHYQHHSNPDPLFNPGLQDITAHVDFTAVAEAAEDNNLEISGYTNLASFLINCGITNFIETSIKQAQELNTLTSPAEMGELFKAMILTRSIDIPLVGFSQFDKLHTL